MRIKYVFVILLFVCVSCSKLPGKNTKKVCYKNDCIDVEVAMSRQAHQVGLQRRDSLEEDRGMLFIFPNEGMHRFWMKETRIPLDIIWINSYREVVFIMRHVPPCLENPCTVYKSNDNAQYVLEINAGRSEKMGFIPGDRLTFK